MPQTSAVTTTGATPPKAPVLSVDRKGPDGPIQITSSTGEPVVNIDSQIPKELAPILELSLAIVIVLFIGAPFAWAIARRIARRGEAKAPVPTVDLRPQLAQLQESVDAMAVELERISEAQRFAARLASERAAALPAAAEMPATTSETPRG